MIGLLYASVIVGSEAKEVWNRDGDMLTIKKTQNTDGIGDNETAVYNREL